VPDPGGRPGLATLAFTLDGHGVRPIRIRSRLRGLRISARTPARCTPREDTTLVTASMRRIINSVREARQYFGRRRRKITLPAAMAASATIAAGSVPGSGVVARN
jgi:hypothetical protein